ncbi:MAG: reverse transcriptase/maturase family protein [Candidatus Niameybacter stercoravium]|nr:reverse transcriptase/maturase family protein [Candidatus Niameybacter stercoravium]
MKIRNVYQEICSFENLYKAYMNARKCKRYRQEVLGFTNNLEEYLFNMRNDLLNHTYVVGEYREFYIHEPKKRLIMALPFYDRVIQWAIYQVINPMFSKGYITDSYACIEGRGAHQAVKRLHYWLRQVDRKDEKWYYLKLDIAKYFYRIDHQALIKILRRKIYDKDLMCLLETIINSETAFGLELGINDPAESKRVEHCGMPIGNLTSQMFANIYLNELDQYLKRKLSVHYYIRYMDDMILLSNDKKKLHEYKALINEFLQENLKLDLNNKTAIRPISLGIEFVGYKLWPTHVKLRKSTALKMKRRMKQVKKQYERGKISLGKVSGTIASYNGVLKHCNSYNLRTKLLGEFVLHRERDMDIEDIDSEFESL